MTASPDAMIVSEEELEKAAIERGDYFIITGVSRRKSKRTKGNGCSYCCRTQRIKTYYYMCTND